MKLIIDRIEEDKAVLIAEDGARIIWPKDKLPENIKEGAVLHFEIKTDEEATNNKKQLAKDILNEILDTGSSD